jgi:hypothetical protein
MEIKRSGSQPSAKGPVEYFSGEVRIDPLFEPPAPLWHGRYRLDAEVKCNSTTS